MCVATEQFRDLAPQLYRENLLGVLKFFTDFGPAKISLLVDLPAPRECHQCKEYCMWLVLACSLSFLKEHMHIGRP